ncbi:MAG: arsenate reductase family protein [Lachnospiraceae bacterium]
MNVQIFGTKKCFDAKKAERYFKERKIKYQFIDLKEKGMSKGEFTKVKQAVGGLEQMLNPACRDQDTLALVKYLSEDQKDAKVLENQQILKTPIVRNGNQATIGYVPEIWKGWA